MNYIYCTDIDRTIMFSQRALHQYLPDAKVATTIRKSLVGDGREVAPGYISVEYLEGLRKFCNSDNIFGDRRIAVAATCRTTPECKILRFYYDFDYIICDSGAKILHKGEEVEEYTEFLFSFVKGYTERIKSAYRLICQDDRIMSSISRIRLMDDARGVFIKLKDAEDVATLVDSEFGLGIKDICEKSRLTWSNNKGKIYLMPHGIDKGFALKWLKSDYLQLFSDDTVVVSSGDTDVDVPMFCESDRVYLMGNHTLSKFEAVKDRVKANGSEFVVTLPGPEGAMQVMSDILKAISTK